MSLYPRHATDIKRVWEGEEGQPGEAKKRSMQKANLDLEVLPPQLRFVWSHQYQDDSPRDLVWARSHYLQRLDPAQELTFVSSYLWVWPRPRGWPAVSRWSQEQIFRLLASPQARPPLVALPTLFHWLELYTLVLLFQAPSLMPVLFASLVQLVYMRGDQWVNSGWDPRLLIVDDRGEAHFQDTHLRTLSFWLAGNGSLELLNTMGTKLFEPHFALGTWVRQHTVNTSRPINRN